MSTLVAVERYGLCAGDGYDIVLAEAINGLPVVEMIHLHSLLRSLRIVEFVTLELVHCFNSPQIKERKGNISPTETE